MALSTTNEWKDDVWPIRAQTPWDISTDYPYPRKLQYDVEEGTWLRLDVHPKTGDIVFDMLGDIYCLPASEYGQRSGTAPTAARPVLLGVPHDSDPRFSPGGETVVFRSDAELGVENIWVMKWTSCEEMDVGSPRSGNDELREAVALGAREDEMLASRVKESPDRKRRRLLREGRLVARRVTNETYRWVSDARFHPSGDTVIATKWYTSSRSLGAGEGWEYPVPSLEDDSATAIEAGSGRMLIGRSLPPGWTAEQYGDQQIGPEQFIWRGNDSVIYAKNVKDVNGVFTYSKDVHSGIYAIFSRNLTTNTTETLVDSFPGGASRPELSRDERTLAFVRRVRDKEALVLKDLVTGTIRHIWHGLTYDLSIVSAPMGTYPSFAFTPSDDAIIIWAAGKIYSVPLSTNFDGEKVAAGEPQVIPFRAHVEKRLAETLTASPDILGLETADTQRARAFKEVDVDEQGARVVFSTAGKTYVQAVGAGDEAVKLPGLVEDAPYYSPSFVPGYSDMVLHARWSDINFTTFELANVTSGEASVLTGLPRGRYYAPVLCECPGRRRQIAFVKNAGDWLTGDVVATAGAGLYLGSLELPSASASGGTEIEVTNVHLVPSQIDLDDRIKLRFLEKNAKLLVQQSDRAFVIDLASGPDGMGKYKHETVATGRMSKELVVSPGLALGNPNEGRYVAFVDFFDVYVAPPSGEAVWSKPSRATKGLARLSLDGGHDITWSRDGKRLFWFLGPFLHTIEISKLARCESEIAKDPVDFGISCVRNLVEYQEVVVRYPTDIKRLKEEAGAHRANRNADPRDADVLAVVNATILTMRGDSLEADLIEDGVMVTRGGVIESVGPASLLEIPSSAAILDVQGGLVVPGFIDGHAHWNGVSARYPAKSWELETFLAYGVTTLHNPSSDNVLGYDERNRLESGQMVGPRIYHTGDVIYGAGEPSLHQDIVDQDEAYSALLRIKAEGGPASFSYKNYNQPSRASRQRLLLAARNLSMICVPEGGMNQDWDLTYIIDGMTTVEHALPVPELYDDVLTLYALSGTASTPTHVVNYGGAWGEQYVWAHEDIPNDAKLREFTRHDVLEGLSETTWRPKNSFALYNTSASVAKMVQNSLHVLIGAHGEPPLGLNYHAEMYFTQQGGLSNYEVLRAATSDAAKTLGLYSALGSVEGGKLADYVVYPAGVELLKADIQDSRNIWYVARGGRLWEAATMVEVWPVSGRKEQMPPLNAE
ncbi:hypothetical protein GLOTRDRAFT_118109 [Gloeophyllum trabeum ATCC 11539]|uniref:Amidohydrolase-related domain-containing protein n=1 Tax=Gloeophyllum trabeum (strain ATCC 11539 / FP-39264 / Madison 617) TaxID=670483 RepID=S7PUJ9_GLOTA|nr:uncharacterized protein GLOTRDRAFT_118109 [Gloeophyllum trabeum ATCC 11539]EPQ51053.1 hypothetical protein GLOTRDRAFT_118109 [Gloeophyllum trabeum ATCC 11539]